MQATTPAPPRQVLGWTMYLCIILGPVVFVPLSTSFLLGHLIAGLSRVQGGQAANGVGACAFTTVERCEPRQPVACAGARGRPGVAVRGRAPGEGRRDARRRPRDAAADAS